MNLLKLSISAGSAEACVTGRCCDFKLAAWIKKKKKSSTHRSVLPVPWSSMKLSSGRGT